MNYFNVLVILVCILWGEIIETDGAETKKDRHEPVLNFYVKSKVSRHVKNMNYQTESEITDGDTLMIKCTTKHVHMWDGKLDMGKFTVGMRPITRNSTDDFSSTLWMRLGESPIQDFLSSPVGQNYVKCFGVEQEEENAAECVYLDPGEHRNSDKLTNNTRTEKGISLSVNSCPPGIVEFKNESSQGEISIQKDIPEWLWNAENNSVVCHVDNPSRIHLKSVYCENPSLCNMRRLCTVQTCPSFVVDIPPCEKGCNRLSMQVNYISGQLQCEANGFITHLNFLQDLKAETCYYNPRGSLSACQVLDLEIPDTDVFHGFPLQLYGRASKFAIIQEPKVEIILSSGQIIRPSVHIVSQLKNSKNLPYFIFMFNSTANSDTTFIKVIGHKYDSNDPLIIRKRLNVKVGEAPKITGLPNELDLLKTESSTVLPFKTKGLPDPTFVLFFNGMRVLRKTDHRFNIFVNQKGYKFLKIGTSPEDFSGILRISARNIFGEHSCKIVIKETFQLTRIEAYSVSLVLAVIFIFAPYPLFNGIVKIWGRHRPKPTAV